MPWSWAAFMPHPPIIVPEVGRGREQDARQTLDGMQRLVAALTTQHATQRPDCLVFLSPHQPYARGGLFINTAASLHGSLALFGAPSVSFSLHTDDTRAPLLETHLKNCSIPVVCRAMPDITKDHSTLVPLYYLARSFPDGDIPPVIIANPVGLAPAMAARLGEALASFAGNGLLALVASGDLSHRLTPGAPGGFDAAGAPFDQKIVDALQRGDAAALVALDENFTERAGECGLRSAITLLSMTGQAVPVFSYEGPFGVGYCTALWTAPTAAPAAQSKKEQKETTDTASPLPGLARMVVSRYLSHTTNSSWQIPPAVASLAGTPGACFVSIKTTDGALRGCIGTILPVEETLAEEIAANAVSAAVRDPRFPPMTFNELEHVRFSVDVLSAPEPVHSLDDLDPKIWGVIVTKGNRRGLLLPDLEGVTSVKQQLDIAARKAGLSTWKNAELQRFSVTRHPEE